MMETWCRQSPKMSTNGGTRVDSCADHSADFFAPKLDHISQAVCKLDFFGDLFMVYKNQSNEMSGFALLVFGGV